MKKIVIAIILLLTVAPGCARKKSGFKIQKPDLTRLLREDPEEIDGKFLLYLVSTDTGGRCSRGCQVFEGDSNIHMINWQAAFREDTCNKAVSRSRTDHLLARKHLVNRLKPKRIIVQVGGNNLLQGWNLDDIEQEYRKLVRYYLSVSGDVRCVSVLPFHRSVSKTDNDEVRELNRRIENICNDLGARYIPVFDLFYDGMDLKDACRSDPVHLNLKGQLRLAAAILLAIH